MLPYLCIPTGFALRLSNMFCRTSGGRSTIITKFYDLAKGVDWLRNKEKKVFIQRLDKWVPVYGALVCIVVRTPSCLGMPSRLGLPFQAGIRDRLVDRSNNGHSGREWHASFLDLGGGLLVRSLSLYVCFQGRSNIS